MNKLEYLYHAHSYVLWILIAFIFLITIFRYKKSKKTKNQKGGGGFGGCVQAFFEFICYMLSFGTLCKNYKTTWSINCKGGGGDGIFYW
jgi:hypothetical protein